MKPSTPAHDPAEVLLPLARRRPRALYVHVPFCARRCPYCDFATTPLRREVEARYLEALSREAARRLPASFRARTVFLGGGTPAELTSAGVARLVEALAPWVGEAREVTLEANPRTLLRRKLEALRAGLGVDRLSLGAQSFQPHLLEALGRFHRPEDVAAAVALAREVGLRSVSVDLIFAVPGQTDDDLARDLEQALALEPDHVSLYGLTLEPGTDFHRRWRAGRLREAPAGRQARLFARARRTLRAAGFEHYEISNFARPGHRCRHNYAYWRNHSYVGLGNGAASHVRGVRATNHRDVAAYAAAVEGGGRAVAEAERLEPAAKVRETAYLALRTSAGIRRAAFRRDTGEDAWTFFGDAWERLSGLGLVDVGEERIRLTGRGVSLADAVAVEVL